MKVLMHTPRYVDSVACTIADGFLDLGHEVYNTKGKLNYGEPAPNGSLYDLYLMADTDDSEALKYISRAGHPQIIIHGHDRWTDYLRAPVSPIKPVPDQYCDIMFVRDLDEEVQGRKWYPTYPLDYGIERRYIEAVLDVAEDCKFMERPDDVVFYGTLTTANRERYLNALKATGTVKVKFGKYEFNTPDSKWSEWVHGRYTHDPAYYRALTRSKMVFCPIGAGSTCFRHMEAYAAGCIPLIQRPPDEIIPLHKFVDGYNCLMWEDEKELIDKVEDCLADPISMYRLHINCMAFASKHLLTKHVAQFILDKIKEHGLL